MPAPWLRPELRVSPKMMYCRVVAHSRGACHWVGWLSTMAPLVSSPACDGMRMVALKGKQSCDPIGKDSRLHQASQMVCSQL